MSVEFPRDGASFQERYLAAFRGLTALRTALIAAGGSDRDLGHREWWEMFEVLVTEPIPRCTALVLGRNGRVRCAGEVDHPGEHWVKFDDFYGVKSD